MNYFNMKNIQRIFTAIPCKQGIKYQDHDTGVVVVYDKRRHVWNIKAPGPSYYSALSSAHELAQYIESTLYQSLV